MPEEMEGEEAVKRMLAFMKSNLVLDDLVAKETNQSLTISGAGFNGVGFDLEVVTSVKRAIGENILKKSAEKSREQGRYHAFVFPRSNYHKKADPKFLSPYLIPGWKHLGLVDLFEDGRFRTEEFERFGYTNVAALSNAEKYVVDQHKADLGYFHPAGKVQVIGFRRFPKDSVIPADFFKKIRMDGYLLNPTFRPEHEERRKDFSSRQNGLRERVRKIQIYNTFNDGTQFTLQKLNGKARIVAYQQDTK